MTIRTQSAGIVPLPIALSDPRMAEVRHLLASIREAMDAAGIGCFCDIPELARAATLVRVAERVASREV